MWWLFSRQTVSVTPNQSVLKAAALMQKRNFRHLPVMDESGRLLGMVSAQDVIDSLHLASRGSSSAEALRESLEIPVERIMSIHCIVVERGDGLFELVKKITQHNLGALPFVNDYGVVQGIITLRDLMSLMGICSDQLDVPVSELMTTEVTTIEPDSTPSKAIGLMSEKRVRRLPIVSRQGQLVGVLTNKDILRLVTKMATESQSSTGFDVPISQIMTADVITVSHLDDIRVAASRMMIFGVGGLVVDDLPSKKFALITERDLIRKLSAKRSIDFLLKAMQYELEAESAVHHPSL